MTSLVEKYLNYLNDAVTYKPHKYAPDDYKPSAGELKLHRRMRADTGEYKSQKLAPRSVETPRKKLRRQMKRATGDFYGTQADTPETWQKQGRKITKPYV